MAAMTPFIAVFKPVSPIVWLPIALILVGGFIQDPETNVFIPWLWELPLLGEYKINPAFIASAITVALCSLWPTLVNTALGVSSIEKDHINVARVLRLNFTTRLVKIIIPSALPLMFVGLRISLGSWLDGLIAKERVTVFLGRDWEVCMGSIQQRGIRFLRKNGRCCLCRGLDWLGLGPYHDRLPKISLL